MKFATLNAWLTWLETLHPKEIDLGLNRIKQVATTMGLLDQSATVITVAGTNGKGSFVKTLSSLLQAEKARVGCYTSPHLICYNERIAINGQNASDLAICEAFEAIDKARGAASLSYFEFSTLAALYLFKSAMLDYLILEVGLGGRLDAVNIIDADISVITAIGIDHEAWLGSNREDIGREKAGILRQGKPFICVDNAIPNSIRAQAETLNCDRYFLGEQIHLYKTQSGTTVECTQVDAHTHRRDTTQFQLMDYHLPLPSLAAALQCLCLVRKIDSAEKISAQVASIRLEGRFERLMVNEQNYILDVAHNPQAAEYLAAALKRQGYENLVAVFACMQDKDLNGVVEPLLPYIQHWVCVDIPGLSRSFSGEALANEVRKFGASAHHEMTPEQGLKRAKDIHAQSGHTILVFGSFYLLADIKPLLDQS